MRLSYRAWEVWIKFVWLSLKENKYSRSYSSLEYPRGKHRHSSGLGPTQGRNRTPSSWEATGNQRNENCSSSSLLWRSFLALSHLSGILTMIAFSAWVWKEDLKLTNCSLGHHCWHTRDFQAGWRSPPGIKAIGVEIKPQKGQGS